MNRQLYKHSARTYHEIYNSLVTAYPQLPDDLFVQIAGLFDFCSELMNRMASDVMQPDTRESAYFFASANSYDPVEADGCTVDLTITLKSAMSKTLPAGYQVGGISSANGQMIVFELMSEASSGGSDTITASFRQKETFTNQVVGSVGAQTAFLEIPITGYTKIIKDSISVTIDGQGWTRVDNFDGSGTTDRHFILRYQSSGKAFLLFGNGQQGAIPALGENIFASFAITKGLSGIMGAGEINLNVGDDSDIDSVTNSTATSGGNDSESVDSIIRNARANNRLRDIIWSDGDMEAAAQQASSSVVKAKAFSGVGEASVHIIPSNGGLPGTGLKSTVQSYVQALTQFGKMPVNVLDPKYKTVDIQYTVTARSGFDLDTVEHLTEFALTLASCAFDNQIIEYYNDYGIDACRTSIINSIWSWNFVAEDNDALAYVIDYWNTLLADKDFREWGQPLEVGQLWVIGESLSTYGSDVFNLKTPLANVDTDANNPDEYIINTGTVAKA